MSLPNEFQKALVRGIGQTRIVIKRDTKEVHIPQRSHDGSVERLFSSKRFKKAMPKGREVVKEGEEKALARYKYTWAMHPKNRHRWFWFDPMTGIRLRKARYVSPKTCKADNGELFAINKDADILVEDVFSYLFTIKTSNMATKKAAPKKAAKKVATKKEGGPGKIEQIIALHKQGLSNKEIVEKGFNKTTVSIQVSKFKRAKEAAKASKKKG